MRVVICHLSRMAEGYICAAGIAPETGEHIRPCLYHSRLTRQMLHGSGGIFDLGMETDIQPAFNFATPPEMEDRLFSPERSSALGMMNEEAFGSLLQTAAKPTLQELFGPDLYTIKQSAAVNAQCGSTSLGILRPQAAPQLILNASQRPRMVLQHNEETLNLSITDLRLVEPDLYTLRMDVVQQVQQNLEANAPILLAVGLTRLWRKTEDDVPKHWLQINTLHFLNHPLHLPGTANA